MGGQMLLHDSEETVVDAKLAQKFLKDGNERYASDELASRTEYVEDRKILANQQHPFAVVLCCSDSRVAPEIFFDQKLGDLFVIRNAGNSLSSLALGSIEYAVVHLKTPLIVVCGHSNCGAVSAAFNHDQTEKHITDICECILPSCKDGFSLDETIKDHSSQVKRQIEEDLSDYPGVTCLSAYYDINTGVVEWLD